MKEPLVQKFSFDGIVVDPKANAIHINHIEKRLEPKLIMLLCLFAAQGKQVISRQEITDAIWPHVVVGEESITRAIFALRNALGDDAKQPRYIETIPKKGYRFLADVQEVQDVQNVSITPEAGQTSIALKSTRARYQSHMLIALVVIILIAISPLHNVVKNALEKNVQEIDSILPVSKFEGSEREISLNSEGSRLLFIHDNGSTGNLYVHDFDTSTDTLMAQDAWRKSSPQWIDENTFTYIRSSGNEYQIVRQYQKQPPEILYSSNMHISQIMVAGWNTEILFLTEFTNHNVIELKTINLSNGKKENLRDTIPELPNAIARIGFSHHRNILLIASTDHEKQSIVSLDLLNKTLSLFNDKFSRVSKMAAMDENTIMVAGAVGTTQGIWSVSENNNPQLILRASGTEDIIDVEIDKKHNAMFYANFQIDSNVNLITADKAGVEELRALNSAAMDMSGVFSADANTIYFFSNRTGYFELWCYERETKTVKQLSTLNAFSISTFVISNSGQQIAVGYKTDSAYLGIVDIKTGKLIQHVKTPANRFPLSWSNDDKAIYVSEHETQVNLFKVDVETLTESIVAKNAGLYAQEYGQKLMYASYSQNGLLERDLTSGQETVLTGAITGLPLLFPGALRVKPDANGFYIDCSGGGQQKLCEYSFDLSLKKPSVVLNTQLWGARVTDIAKDGKSILVTAFKPSSGDIMKIQFKK